MKVVMRPPLPCCPLSNLLTKATAATLLVIPWPQGLSPLTILPLGPTIPWTIIFPLWAVPFLGSLAPDLAASVLFASVAFEELLCQPLLLSYLLLLGPV